LISFSRISPFSKQSKMAAAQFDQFMLRACGASVAFGALVVVAPVPTLAGVGVVLGVGLAHQYVPPTVHAVLSAVGRALTTTTKATKSGTNKSIPNNGNDEEYEMIS
jgi:hypothetical protein